MRVVVCVIACIALLLNSVRARVYFSEDFQDGDAWESRWIKAYPKTDEGSQGEWAVDGGKYRASDAERGLKTTEDHRFYTISARHDDFSNRGKDLVVQYSVKNEQDLDCGGGYIKLAPSSTDQENFEEGTPYNIMFGPDICGDSKRKVHVIFNHDGKNHLIKKDIPCKTDLLSHLYTLIVRSDNTYEVRIDNEKKESGSLEDDWDMLLPKEIDDPEDKKPEDWVDEDQIADPEDKKPEDWDDIPKEIPDPDAEKPEDWDDDLDGEWEAPMIENPEYNGEWKPKMIPNPDYKGEWKPRRIPNPDYKSDPELYAYDSFGVVGIEIWQVKSGSFFDDFLITDDVAEAERAAKIFSEKRDAEKVAYEKEQEELNKKAEEEAKKREDEMEERDEDGDIDLDIDDDSSEEPEIVDDSDIPPRQQQKKEDVSDHEDHESQNDEL